MKKVLYITYCLPWVVVFALDCAALAGLLPGRSGSWLILLIAVLGLIFSIWRARVWWKKKETS